MANVFDQFDDKLANQLDRGEWSLDVDRCRGRRADGAQYRFVRSDPFRPLDWTVRVEPGSPPLSLELEEQLLALWTSAFDALSRGKPVGGVVDLLVTYGFTVLDLEHTSLSSALAGEGGIVALMRRVQPHEDGGPPQFAIVAVEDSADVLATAAALLPADVSADRRRRHHLLLRLEPSADARAALLEQMRGTLDPLANVVDGSASDQRQEGVSQ